MIRYLSALLFSMFMDVYVRLTWFGFALTLLVIGLFSPARGIMGVMTAANKLKGV